MKTIDLDLAKELQSVCKEKGITMPESELVWMPYKDIVVGRKGTHRHYFNPAFISENYRDLIKDDWHKAYTLDELLEWLPEYINEHDIEYLKFEKVDDHIIKYGKTGSTYAAYYEFHGQFASFTDPNPANAACKLLIYLLEEGLI